MPNSVVAKVQNQFSGGRIIFSTNGAEAITHHIKRRKEEKDFLKKVEKLVYEQMKEKHVNCDTVCESLGITNQNLRRKILAITGQTGGKYLLTIRLDYAKELLSTGRYTVGQVALKCGYDDANNFSRTFKREIGQKPTEYAANNKK